MDAGKAAGADAPPNKPPPEDAPKSPPPPVDKPAPADAPPPKIDPPPNPPPNPPPPNKLPAAGVVVPPIPGSASGCPPAAPGSGCPCGCCCCGAGPVTIGRDPGLLHDISASLSSSSSAISASANGSRWSPRARHFARCAAFAFCTFSWSRARSAPTLLKYRCASSTAART